MKTWQEYAVVTVMLVMLVAGGINEKIKWKWIQHMQARELVTLTRATYAPDAY